MRKWNHHHHPIPPGTHFWQIPNSFTRSTPNSKEKKKPFRASTHLATPSTKPPQTQTEPNSKTNTVAALFQSRTPTQKKKTEREREREREKKGEEEEEREREGVPRFYGKHEGIFVFLSASVLNKDCRRYKKVW